ncbi:MBOAT family protein [Aquimarina sp. RZ0]|uniref:MBOAT family O-acyltransferase n=1 Tax=Aquimarina sp. RZ0 TaxID=2607730 RepID=UPI0011F25819|nr:MBOAT family O-acyltransferase [Aquimarina sp. RZ0]KAA1246942.1 MBOAT family protein [Aquimarina sp. RZ0]
MLFNSIEYLVFLPLVFLLYWLLRKKRPQNILLLVSSYLFYGWWDWRFLSLIIFSSFVDYFIGLKIDQTNDQKIKKRWLITSLVSNLGLLGLFKYFNFFTESFTQSMQLFGWEVDTLTLNLILPVGISFYTFQTLSYTIDIYRKQLKPTTDIVSFFTYISFFPQLVAGPIERAANLLPQIESKRKFEISYFKSGIFQIFIGLFRKIVVADNLAVYVDSVYGDVAVHNTTTLVIATIFYAFQIYFDFAGYSDIAIGSAKLLGFKFERNFNTPYFSKSITEFWRRWHMSLSFWLRDYLYISLGGNRKGIKITYRNLMITMLLGGLWHGSSWNFVIWGAIHGLFLMIEKYIFSKSSYRSFGILGYGYTFIIVLVSWVFFRAHSFQEAIIVCKGFFSLDITKPFIGDINTFSNSLFMLSLSFLFDIFLSYKNVSLEDFGERFKISSLTFFITIIIIIMCLFYSSSENFIYFQF